MSIALSTQDTGYTFYPFVMRYQFLKSSDSRNRWGRTATFDAMSLFESPAALQFVVTIVEAPGGGRFRSLEIRDPELHRQVQDWKRRYPNKHLSFASAIFNFCTPSARATSGAKQVMRFGEKPYLFSIKLIDVTVMPGFGLGGYIPLDGAVIDSHITKRNSVSFLYDSKHCWGNIPPHLLDCAWGVAIDLPGI